MIIYQGFNEAFNLIINGDNELLRIAWLSLKVSGIAVIISMILGIPLGTWLAQTKFPGRRLLISLVNTGMGLPPVVVGLIVVMMLWRSGPLGFLQLLYTPAAIITAQIIIALPVVTGISLAAIQQLDPRLRLQTLALGASRRQLLFILWRQAKLPLLAAAMAGFGAIISEVGAVMMVGGNIKGETRVLTTAMVLETRMGRFNMAIALAVVLLLLVFGVNLIMTWIQQRE